MTLPTSTSQPPRNFSALYLVTATAAMGYGFVVSLLAEFRDEYGFSGLGLGILAGAGFFSGFFANVWLARYADKGWSREMIRIGLAMGLIASIWMAASSDIFQFVAARVLVGLGAGLCGPPIRKIIIARNPGDMGRKLGVVSAFDIGGFIAGPLIATTIANFFGLKLPFVVLAAAFGAMLLLIWREDLTCPVVDSSKTQHKISANSDDPDCPDSDDPDSDDISSGTATKKPRGNIRQLLAIPGIQGAIAAGVAFYASIGVFEVSWALLLDDNGAPTWLVGPAFSLFTIPMMVFAPIGGRVTHKHGALKVIVWSVAVALVCVVAYGWVDHLWILLAISGVHAIADAFTLPGLQVAMATSSPEEYVASSQGLLGATGLAVAGAIASVGGPIYAYGGAEMLYSLAGVIMITSLLFAIYRSLDPTMRFATGRH